MCEHKALKPNSKVDLYRIVNCKSMEKGCRKLTQRKIDELTVTVKEVAKKSKGSGSQRRRPVARKVLQAIAQGRLSVSECLVLLFYSSRRISQLKTRAKLKKDERYGRFRYCELGTLTGIEKSRIGEAIAKLRKKGFLHVIRVHQANVNRYGLCFVDGWLISLYRTMRECVTQAGKAVMKLVKKTATARLKISNALPHKTASPINKKIKRSNKKKKACILNENESLAETLARLKTRCLAIEQNVIPETA